MLQRILALGGEVIARYDTSSLRYIASSGSALGAPLATAVLRRFGPDPLQHLRLDRGLAGHDRHARPTCRRRRRRRGGWRRAASCGSSTHDGHEVPTGGVGRVFVGSGARFDGYTGGGGKEQIDGLLSSGDLGHFDAKGRLFIDGRDDDMIVSGGENVFPAEVEDLLAAHPAILEAAVIGVPDEEFGQRLKAFVVRRPGARLTQAQVKEHVREHLARVQGAAYGDVRGRPAPHDDRQAPAPRPVVSGSLRERRSSRAASGRRLA